MKLMTKEIEEELRKYPLYSQENEKIGQHKVVVKYFNPYGIGTWLVCEGNKLEDGDYEFFGCVKLWDNPEYGYFFLSDLLSVPGIEREIYGKPVKVIDEFREYYEKFGKK